MTTGILIDPFDHVVREVEYEGDYRKIYDFIQAHTFSTVCVNREGDHLFVDDEGLLVNLAEQEFFKFRDYDQPLAGRALLLGSLHNGDTSPKPHYTRDDVCSRVVWLTRLGNIFIPVGIPQ